MPDKMKKGGKGKVRSRGESASWHSVLIVSASEQFDHIVRKSLQGFVMIDSMKNAAAARRSILEKYYDLIVINAPLPGEPGDQLALDLSDNLRASVLLAIPSEVYEEAAEGAADHGIYVVPKPLEHRRLDQVIRFLFAVQDKLHLLEKQVQTAEEKLEEVRVVDRAKLILVESRRMTEDEAHRFIGKQAMDRGLSRKRVAEEILEEMDE